MCEAAESFYSQTLGFATSDSPNFPGVGKIASFMYCNPRHHSFAFFGNPQPRRQAYHVMLEHTSIDDVGSAFDICQVAGQGESSTRAGTTTTARSRSTPRTRRAGSSNSAGARATIDPDNFAVEHYSVGGGSGMGEWGHAGLMESVF